MMNVRAKEAAATSGHGGAAVPRLNRAGASRRHTRKTVAQYFRLGEKVRPMELVYGVVREPPAPRYAHQAIVTNLGACLHAHARATRIGRVCVSPLDVVLDRDKALVIQPDIVFVAADRLDIIRDRIWGAPDLVIEVLSPGTAKRDRTTKLGWYRKYGVAECWLVDAKQQQVEVIRFTGPEVARAAFAGARHIRSHVLPRLALRAAAVFEYAQSRLFERRRKKPSGC